MGLHSSLSPILCAGALSRWNHGQRGVCTWPGTTSLRLDDCARIADRCVDDWCRVAEGKDLENVVISGLELVFVERLFSFVVFSLAGWTCLHGIRGSCEWICSELSLPGPVFSKTVDPQSGIIFDLREFRNKTVAHFAMLEPRNETISTCIAYFDWNYGIGKADGDARNLTMNHINRVGRRVDGSEEVSEQVKLPPLMELRDVVATEYLAASTEIGIALANIASCCPRRIGDVEWKHYPRRDASEGSFPQGSG